MKQIYKHTIQLGRKLLVGILLCVFFISAAPHVYAARTFIPVQSVDTMKYSRDLARSKLTDPSFDDDIKKQLEQIASIGATHVAIATPYDEEFIPILTRWVDEGRRQHLKIWFRGNMSGWEGWFNYPDINRTEHTQKIVEFIHNHPLLFEDGDIFSSCTECENGGPGDPRAINDAEGHRKFLISEYKALKQAFASIHKDVKANYFSMNGDVARLIMDQDTTRELDGVVTIDHYVKNVDQLIKDVNNLAEQSGGKIVLGEFGAPIPDIHGDMTPHEQAAWIDDAMKKIINNKNIIAVNYWVNYGGSTHLWDDDGSPLPAVEILSRYYKPSAISGTIHDEIGFALSGVTIKTKYTQIESDNGSYSVPILDDDTIRFTKNGHVGVTLHIDTSVSPPEKRDIIMEHTQPSFWQKFLRSILSWFRGS